MIDKRAMPYDEKAEQAVIGSLMIENGVFDKIMCDLAPEDFYHGGNKLIFSAIIELLNAGKVADLVTVCETLSASGSLKKAGGNAYVAETVDSVVSAYSINSYAAIVKEKSIERKIISEASRIIEAVYDQTGEGKTKLEEAQKTILNLSLDKESGTLKNAREICKSTFAGIEYRHNNRFSMIGHSTGILDLDSATSGLIGGDLIILAGRPGMGKAQTLDTPILMDNGKWKKMGVLKVGDKLASVNGCESVVTAVYDRGGYDVFNVTFSDGRSTKVCGDHLWSIKHREWETTKIINTNKLSLMLKSVRYKNRLSIQRVSGDFGKKKKLPLDPYVLGALLGDGSFRNNTARITSADEELISEIRNRLPVEMSIKRVVGSYAYSIISSKSNNCNRGFIKSATLPKILSELKLQGLGSENKFIPPVYMCASKEQRLDMLRGLMDTDGWSEKLGSVRFMSCSKRLAEDVCKLVRSLGGVCSVVTKQPTCKVNGKDLKCKLAYMCRIRHETAEDFFLLERKRIRSVRGRNNKVSLNVKSIKPCGFEPVRCISVSHESHLYVTNDYIVTHNSAVAGNIAATVAAGGNTVLLFSLEMHADSVMTRIMARESGINSRNLRRGQLADTQWPMAVNAAGAISRWPFFIDDKPDITPQEIRAKARKIKKENGLGLLIVDYIQLVRVTGKHDSREQAVAEISRTLKAIARELEIPVIGLSQLNRNVDGRPDKHPMLSDLRESGAIEQDADIIIFIYRDEVYNKSEENPKRGLAEFDIAKHRNGETGRFEVIFDARTQHFRNKAKI